MWRTVIFHATNFTGRSVRDTHKLTNLIKHINPFTQPKIHTENMDLKQLYLDQWDVNYPKHGDIKRK